jgi:hypothetical protein
MSVVLATDFKHNFAGPLVPKYYRLNYSAGTAGTNLLDFATDGTDFVYLNMAVVCGGADDITKRGWWLCTNPTLATLNQPSSWKYLGVDYAAVIAAIGYTPLNKAGDTMTGLLTLSADPTSALHAATKNYVDGMAAGIIWTDADALATTNITLSGEQTIDGFTTSASTILVIGQTDQTTNGFYTTAAGAWTRSSFANTAAKLIKTAAIIKNGTVNANTNWANTNTAITLGTTNITFTKISGISITNGTGLSLTGNVMSLDTSYTDARYVLQSNGAYVKNITLNTPGVLYTNPINFTVSGNTATGTLSLVTQSPNTLLAGPASGVTATTPTFRALVPADFPLGGYFTWTGGHSFNGGMSASSINSPNIISNNFGVLDQSGTRIGTTATGTDTYTASLSPSIPSYNQFQAFHVLFTNTNTVTNPTIAIDGLAAKTIVKGNNLPLAAGDLKGVCLLIYNGTNFQLIGSSTSSGTTVNPANPTQSIGLSIVNGTAATFMRSDAAPALDQSIAPTWTGLHTHSFSSNAKAIDLLNPTAATNVLNQKSPYLQFSSYGWSNNSSVSQLSAFKIYNDPYASNNASPILRIDALRGDGTTTQPFSISQSGISTSSVFVAGGMNVGSGIGLSGGGLTLSIQPQVVGPATSNTGYDMAAANSNGTTYLTQWSPRVQQTGTAWNGVAASQSVTFQNEVRTFSGTNPITGKWVISTITTGSSSIDALSIDNLGYTSLNNLAINGTADPLSYFTINGTGKLSRPIPSMTTTQRNAIPGAATVNIAAITSSSANNGNYTNVPLTGGSGTGALASIAVTSSAITTITVTTSGAGYLVGDVLSIDKTLLGGSGTATVPVATLNVAPGTMLFNTTQNSPNYFDGTQWQAIPSASASIVWTGSSNGIYYVPITSQNVAIGAAAAANPSNEPGMVLKVTGNATFGTFHDNGQTGGYAMSIDNSNKNLVVYGSGGNNGGLYFNFNTAKVAWQFQPDQYVNTSYQIGCNVIVGSVGNTLDRSSAFSVINYSGQYKGSIPAPVQTATNKGNITTPATGLHVYQTDGVEGIYSYHSTLGWLQHLDMSSTGVIRLGASTSAAPMLKVNGTNLELKLGDNSAFTKLSVSSIGVNEGASAIVDHSVSSTKGFLFPGGTSTLRGGITGAEGLVYQDTTLKGITSYNNSQWSLQLAIPIANLPANGVEQILSISSGGTTGYSQVKAVYGVVDAYSASSTSVSMLDSAYYSGSPIIAYIAPPTNVTATAVGTGGTFAAGTYYWRVSAFNAQGESVGSLEVSATLVANGSATIAWTASVGATSYRVYRGTSAGAESVYFSLGNVVTFTDTGAAGTGGSVLTTPTGALSGTQGERRAGANYNYFCDSTNVDILLGTIDDSAGPKTSAQMATLYPLANFYQIVLGVAGFYRYMGNTYGWFYTPNITSGPISATGNGTSTAFTITFPQTLAYAPTMIDIMPTSANAASFWITAISTTGFTINFPTAPANAAAITGFYNATR